MFYFGFKITCSQIYILRFKTDYLWCYSLKVREVLLGLPYLKS